MAGLTPAPPAATRLRAEGGTYLSGNLTVLGGAGVTARAGSGEREIQIDGLVPDVAAPASFFVPGPLAVGEVFRFTPRVGRVLLTAGYTYALTAGTGVDASNHHALSVAGSLGGSVEMPMDTTDNAHALDTRSDGAVAGVPTVEGYPHVNESNPNIDAWAIMVRPTATVDVEAVDVLTASGAAYVSPAPLEGASTWVEIREVDDDDPADDPSDIGTFDPLDDDRFPILAESGRGWTYGFQSRGAVPFALDRRLTLTQGRRYWWVLRSSRTLDPDTWAMPRSGGSYAPLRNIDPYLVAVSRLGPESWTARAAPAFRLRGDAGYVELSGQVSAEVVQVGFPTTPPEDVNVFLSLLAGSGNA